MNGSFVFAGLMAVVFAVDTYNFDGRYFDVVSLMVSQLAHHFRLF